MQSSQELSRNDDIGQCGLNRIADESFDLLELVLLWRLVG